MRFLSLFSGIEAASVAWKPLGWECVAVSEIEPFPCSVLAHHYPLTPNLGDVTKITEDQIKQLGHIDIVVFGSPCTDLSIAGKRAGFAGERSGLFFAAIRIIQWARQHCGCRFALWENVAGAFSSNEGRDFAAVVEQMAGCRDVAIPTHGWGSEGAALGDEGMLEWSVLDAQFFGLAQRRKRVFAIVDFGDWANRPPILLERESVRRDSPPSREARQEIARDVRLCIATANITFDRQSSGEYGVAPVASTIAARDYKSASDLVLAFHSTQDPIWSENVSHAMGCGSSNGQASVAVAYGIPGNWIGRKPENGGNATEPHFERSPCLTATDKHGVAFGFRASGQDGFTPDVIAPPVCATDGGGCGVPSVFTPLNLAVRRLTPRECERLQGFPDDWTLVPHKGKIGADSPRYKALGNSMAVNVMVWLGRRIQSMS